jgi:hypothetical protein
MPFSFPACCLRTFPVEIPDRPRDRHPYLFGLFNPEATQWRANTVAEKVGISEDIVARVLRNKSIRLKKTRTWRESKGPRCQ